MKRPSNTLLLALLLTVMVGTVGCVEATDSAESGERVTPLNTGRFALLTLQERAEANDGLEATGQFVRFSGPDSDWALRALDLWVPTAGLGRDSCRPGKNPGFPAGMSTDVSIDLEHAGSVALVGEERSELDIHYIPDLQLYLSGVMYSSGGSSLGGARDGAYRFQSSGLEQNGLPAFEVSVDPPPSLELTWLGEASYSPSREEALVRGQALRLAWVAGEPTGEIYIEIYDDAGGPAPLFECVARDDGEFAMPETIVDELIDAQPGAALRMTVRRAEVAEFDLSGFDWARAVYTSSATAFLVP